MRILFIGDVFGRPGRSAVFKHLPKMLEEFDINFCIANCENSSGGKGLTPEIAEMMYDCGVDSITLGNHAWDNKKVIELIEVDERIVRPYNYPPGVPGRGYTVLNCGSSTIVVAQLLCRLYMKAVDCPFQKADELIGRITQHKVCFIDLHGEATSEKSALGWYVDGRVSAVVGTHTHVPTADERILPKGTAFITDAGMTGPYDSIIGVDIEYGTQNFISPLKHQFKVASDNVKISAVLIDIDEKTGKAQTIQRVLRDA